MKKNLLVLKPEPVVTFLCVSIAMYRGVVICTVTNSHVSLCYVCVSRVAQAFDVQLL